MIIERYRAGYFLPVVCIVVAAVIFCASPAQADQRNYLQDDAKVSGNQINSFPDKDGEMVSVIVGHFSLDIGKRSISGQNAVLWIKTHKNGRGAKHDITAYIEGDVQVIEPNSNTSDKMILVTLHVQGRLSMDGQLSSKPLKNLGLYKRAVKTRNEAVRTRRSWQRRASKQGISRSSEPAMLVRKSAGNEDLRAKRIRKTEKKRAETVRLEKLSTSSDNTESKEPQLLSEATASKAKSTKAKSKARKTPAKNIDEVSAVHIEASGGISGEKDPKDPSRRICVSKGKIYISVGPSSSKDHMELRADYAVIFTRTGLKHEESRDKVPFAPRVIGLPNNNERITGVYLEGDVIMTRGNRKIIGNAMYYDFVENNALILKPVFRTIQEQRNIPIYVRGDKARIRSLRETEFENAIVSTSDFKTPSYQFGARRFTVRDNTPYDEDGEKLSERSFSGEYEHGVGAIRGVPLFWSPGGKFSWEEGHSALRKIQPVFGGQRKFGLETEWQLFRLLGIVKPEGFSATLTASGYKKAAVLGVDMDYERREGNRQYSGYGLAYGMWDEAHKTEFGDERTEVIHRKTRGRLLLRHKEFLPRDWQIQAETSLISDRAYMEEFFSDEYWAGKQQENLIYAKKQRDNWAITALLKTRMNYFLTQTESYPDVSAYLVGQPLWNNRLTYFGEARMGAKRYHASNTLHNIWDDRGMGMMFTGRNARRRNDLYTSSNVMARFDTRHEINLPLQPKTPLGPINVVPYVVARLSAWTDSPGDNGCKVRPYAEFGIRQNMHFWRVYNNVESRLWDVHKLKHVITPEMNFFTSLDGGVGSSDLYPLSPVEKINQNNGTQIALYQRLQTKRGPVGNRRTVDWMRLNLKVGMFKNRDRYSVSPSGVVSTFTGDGRYFFSRPEHSLPRNHFIGEYMWNISDSTAFMADVNWDLDDGQCDRWNIGLAVNRSPRLSYYIGMRYINELDSNAITFGAKYKINKKYSISVFEQYDFRTNGGQNLGTRVSIVRRFPRWNVGLTLLYDQRYSGQDEYGAMLSIWHAGIPEAYVSTGAMKLLNRSDRN